MLQRTKAWRKQMLAGALAVWMLLCAIPQPILAAAVDAFSAATTAVQNASAATQAAAENAYKGKTLSILGASISTYTGISNNAAYNSTISNNAIYYTEGRFGIYANDTWWMQVANDLGLRLLVNNSWSGSSLLYERNGTVGAYVDRCVQLHNNEGEDPDIIGIQMGTNDFQYYKDTLGTADIDYAALITENEDGSFTYATPVTSLEAAAIVLHKISIRYPNAEVYYLNISQRVDGTDELIQSFNAELKQVVEHFGAHIVDIYGSAITMADFDTYIGDGRVHPNRLGMDAYTEAFKQALLANTAYEVDTHTVSLNLDGVTADYGDDKIVVSGDAFSCTLTPADGKELSVSVSMGSENITGTAYKNGMVSIQSVTADVIISAKATVHKPQNYRWEFDGTDLACVRGGNPLTKDTGTTTDGVFSKTSYTLKNEVVLLHDLPWTVEWKCEGTFLNANSSSGARIFTSDNVNANYNARYIFKSNTNGIVAIGEKTTSGSHNYGIALADYGIDWTALHTYRLENRIAADGSNMIWLYVDGEEVGPMNHYYVGTTDKNTTSDWLSGKDFVFPYMGTDTHGFTNASIDYIQVTECIHTYEDGVCTGCGNVASSLSDKTISILGDSISTYAGVSNNTSYNSTIGKNAIYYTEGRLGVYQKDTWWQQTIDALGMRLLVNNSWSGSTVLKPRQGSGSEGYLSRCVNLHNDKTGETPDVIAVFLSTNDFSYYQSSLGTADIDYNALITDNGDGTYIYATPTTTCEAYAIMLHKMQQRYPDAEIYCMTLLPRREPDHDGKDVVPAPTAFNGELAKVIAHFGCTVVDLEHCGITSQPENFDYYISDKRVHPGAAGMDKMSEALISAILGQTITLQHVTSQYTGTNSDNSAAVALPGAAYTANLTVQPGYEDLHVTVTMGGEDITKTAYANGRIYIPTVTGEIVITAKAVKPATDYRWEFADSSVSSVTTGGNKANALTLLGGSVTGGVLQGAYFRMVEQVTLYHHRPWVVEWSAAGGWSGMLLSKLQSSSASGNEYFFKSNSVSIGLIAFGRWENGQYMNYGIRLADHGVDTAARHIYRLENRIAKDGSNAVHLLVDGVDYGAVTRHYIGTSDQGSSANWANGQDLTFGYIGANGHTLNGCDLDYLQVWEGGDTHAHAYSSVVTAPTCTEQGYTTHACACGESYVDDYTDAAGHSYESGTCTVCGFSKKPYQRLTYFTVDVQAENGKIYTDNAVLYLPANYTPDGDPVKLVIYCKQGASQITASSNPIESVGFYNYLISLGYAVLGVDGVPDQWRDDLGICERAVGNPIAVQGTKKAYDYVIENYNIATDGCFISGYSQGGHYAQNVIDLTDIPILAAAEQSPVCSMQYHQWDLNATVTVGGVKFVKGARLNVARIYGFPAFTTNAELLSLAYDASLVAEYDPWVRNNQNVYAGFVQKSNLWYLPEGTSLDDITMKKTVKCPVKIWCAEDDTAISADVMKVFVKAIQNAGGTAEISVAPKGGHGFFQNQTAVGTFTENEKTYNTLPIAVEIAQWFEQYGGYACKHNYADNICTICGDETHIHSYAPTITAPTCTEKGYTTYTCACGDSYVADYVDELGHYHSTADTLASGESLVLTELNIVKHNNSFLFSADVGDLGDGSIWISHGKSAYSGSYLEIKKDKVIVYSIGTTVTSKEYSHGLTITGTVIVRIDYMRSSAKLTITTESGTYTRSIGFGCNGELACGANGVTLHNVDFRWFSSGIESNNWFFGDSWFSTTSAARWTKYLLDDGYTDILLGGYGGMGADKGLIQFRELLQFHTPEYAIWALGMNNGDRNGQINTTWLTNTKAFLELCAEYGVTPILCTIPTTPKVNNRLKNEWIKESGYRYIDFDLALVEDHITGTWFEGTAASDLNHPTEAGALMLYPQVFADFPELAKADPATCTHSLKLLGSREAECAYGGREAYYVCTLCGSTCKDAEAAIRTTTAEMLTPELGHSFTAYISDGNATYEADGTKTALCDRGCGAKDTVTDPGSMLFPEQVTSKVYDISGNTLGKVPVGTTVETLLSGLDWSKYCKVFGASGQVSGTELVGTGMVLKLMDGEVVKQELTIVVIGDTSGDGLITVTDFMQVKAHLLQKQILTGAPAAAADLSGDGAITITDFVQVKALLLQTAA